MRQINIHDAKTHLSRLVEQAAAGEPFVIAKAGRPLVQVIPFDTRERRPPSRFGFLAGEIEVPDDFDTMGQQEIEQLFGVQD